MTLAPEFSAALAAAVAGSGVLLTALGLAGRVAGPSSRPGRRRTALLGRQALFGLAAGVLTLVLTRWVVAGVGIGLLVACWQRLLGGNAEENRGIARLEALANWTESLRDTIAGAIGLEQAIPATAGTSAPALRPSLNLLVDRLRIREPLPDALLRFADDVDDPSADVVVAALVLNARLRGPGLRDVLTALATSTREELDVRRRIEASRRSIRRSVQIVLLIVLGVMGLLAVFNRDYVAPYSSFAGQVALVLVAALMVAGLTWLRRLARVETHERFLAGVSPR
ncbi:type II secretion system F family protein [Kineococcus aurantiacus]|uniref:Flp pilus assembly protein TadB n=1 Tax=Kineococcus aurantiacus TaxID=37633 RepID=A0A7Y9DI27_9ACTN|nr:Flp pilus assembly protein TadB [Kineococcus aurantiacus]